METTDATIKQLHLSDLVAELLERLTAVFGADLSALFLLADRGEELVLCAARGALGETYGTDLRVPLGQGFVGRIAASRQPLVLSDAAEFPFVSDLLRANACSLAGVPVVAHGELIGVIHVAYTEQHPISPEEVALLQVAGDYVAFAVSETRRRASERRERAYFEGVIEALTDAVVIVNQAGKVTRANAAAAELSGYERTELVGMDVDALVPDGARARHAVLRKQYMGPQRSRAMGSGLDLWVRRKDASKVPVEIALSTVQVEDGYEITAVMTDISERRRLEMVIRHQQKMEAIGRFAGGIAHDFNNILTAVLGFAELASKQAGNTPIDGLLTEIRAAGSRAADLTRQLLAFSSRQEFEQRIVDLNTVVLEHEPMLRQLIPENIEVITRLDPTLPPIEVDATRMGQVITNLVVNAFDAMEKGGTLTVETCAASMPDTWHGPTADRQGVLLRISDTGTGMDETVLEHAFEPFFSTKGEEGTGFGLASAHGIVRAFGGEVNLDSKAGEGTVVSVYLPLPSAPQRSAAPDQPADTRTIDTQALRVPIPEARILLVEDEPQVRHLATLMLERLGHTVTVAATPAEALARDDITTFDAVVCDVVMPGVGGVALIKRLRERNPTLRALFISGYTEGYLTRTETLAPHDRLLRKPFTLSDLAESLERTLGLSGSDR